MSALSTRTVAALAFERGEEFDPALTLLRRRSPKTWRCSRAPGP